MAASCPAGVPSDRAAILYRHTPPGTSPPTLLLDQQRHTAPSTLHVPATASMLLAVFTGGASDRPQATGRRQNLTSSGKGAWS
jgi:hypothetical protein